MFELDKISSNIVEFKFKDPFTTEELKKVLAIIVGICEKKSQFAFYVDTTGASLPPFNTAVILRKWLRENKELFRNYLICSSIILSNNTTGNIVKNLVSGVFKIQTPVRPNKIFTNKDKCVEWVKKNVDDHKKTNDNSQKCVS